MGMEFDLLAFFLSGLVKIDEINLNAPREKREQPNKSNGMSFLLFIYGWNENGIQEMNEEMRLKNEWEGGSFLCWVVGYERRAP